MNLQSELFTIPECRISRRGFNLLHVSDQPIEKLLNKGRHVLTERELLAIIIGGGNKDDKALILAGTILASCNYDLGIVSKMNCQELMKFKGIGKNTAVTIATTFELGRRKAGNEATSKGKISCSRDAFEIFQPMLSDLKHEEFWILTLSRANKIISQKQISTGGISGTVVDPKIIFKFALDEMASSLILVHNHPSGNNQPSEADLRLTKKIVEAGNMLDIMVLDHLIIAGNEFYSFADSGKI